jgi:uncharacterized protein (TIGR01777 family)
LLSACDTVYTSPVRYLVTGGTGFVGRAFCASLIEGGHDVTVLTRNPTRVEALFGGEAEAAVDLAALPRAPAPEVVINLAGAGIAEGRWTKRRKVELRDSRLAVTRAVVDYAKRCATAPRVLLSASAVGYYGYHQDEPLTEEAPVAAGDFLAELCRDWEAAAGAAGDLGVRVCLLRLGLVLGRGGGALTKMLPVFRKGLGGRLGAGEQIMSWVHRDDVVGLALRLARDADLSGPFNVTAPEPVSNAEFTTTLGAVLGRSTFMAVPGFALRLALGEMADMLLGGQRVLPARAREEAGYAFSHGTLRGALEAILG